MEGSYHHGALRSALVEAALEMLERGEPLTLRGVARRAGVSHGAPYHHFADRRALLAAVARRGLEILGERLEEALRAEGTSRRALTELGVAYVRFALENPALFRLLFGPELADREGLEELDHAYRTLWGVLTVSVGELLGEQAADEDVRFWSLRGWSMVHGLANLLLDRQVPGVKGIEDAERVARRMLLAGAARVSA